VLICRTRYRRPGHARYRQRHTRFDQHNSAGRPPAGKSRTRRSRRSCSTATTAHEGQPTKSSVVSTCTCNSPSHSALASTRNPGNPSISAAVSCCCTVAATGAGSALSSISTWGLRVRALGRTRIVRPQARLLRQAEGHVATRLTTRHVEEPLIQQLGDALGNDLEVAMFMPARVTIEGLPELSQISRSTPCTAWNGPAAEPRSGPARRTARRAGLTGRGPGEHWRRGRLRGVQVTTMGRARGDSRVRQATVHVRSPRWCPVRLALAGCPRKTLQSGTTQPNR